MAPLAEMYRYAIDLRSMTQARGDFTMEFHDYEEVPDHIAEKVIEEAKKERKADFRDFGPVLPALCLSVHWSESINGD